MRDIKDYEEKYQSEPCEQYQVKYRRKKVLEVLKRFPHKNILEVGCGLEPLFDYMDDYESMTIVEPGEFFIGNAKDIASSKNREIACICDFMEGAVEKLKSLEKEFDYIVVSSLLHEVEVPEKLLKALYEVSTDRTIIHINVPNAKSIHRVLAQKMGLIEDVHELSQLQQKMQRNRVYDIDTLTDTVSASGFTVLERGSYFPKFFSAGQMEDMLRCGIVDDTVFEGLDKMIECLPEFGSEIYVQLKKLNKQ